MRTVLDCPCGERITGRDEDELVELTRAHLADKHASRDYTREEILFMAREG
jgi:hypothetical protein